MHVCKNINVGNRRTSIRIERELWSAVNELCQREGMTVHEVCSLIDKFRGANSLTAALRVFLVVYYRLAATEVGHATAGHGTAAGVAGRGADRWSPIIAQVFQD
jgi:predicted DNA-binding ribbon-helix-helix protein